MQRTRVSPKALNTIYIKTNPFCLPPSPLLSSADSELIYSKSLSKLANKLNKAGREIPGSVADAWRGVATEMESRSDIHRQLAASLTDELVKPLKTVVDNHHKTRKAVS